MLRQWVLANDRLDQTIGRGFECNANFKDLVLPRAIKLQTIYALRCVEPLDEHGRLDELRSVIQMAIRLEGQISREVGSKDPKAVSIETLACAASDLDWLAAQLETVFDRTLPHLHVGYLPLGANNERS